MDTESAFKHARRRETPRYAPVMVGTVLLSVFILLTALARVVHDLMATTTAHPGGFFNAAWAVISVLALIVLVQTCYLWAAWEREESFPELLPKREFDRRYPPGPGAAPARTALYPVPFGQKLDPNGAAMIPKVFSSKPPLPPPVNRPTSMLRRVDFDYESGEGR